MDSKRTERTKQMTTPQQAADRLLLEHQAERASRRRLTTLGTFRTKITEKKS